MFACKMLVGRNSTCRCFWNRRSRTVGGRASRARARCPRFAAERVRTPGRTTGSAHKPIARRSFPKTATAHPLSDSRPAARRPDCAQAGRGPAARGIDRGQGSSASRAPKAPPTRPFAPQRDPPAATTAKNGPPRSRWSARPEDPGEWDSRIQARRRASRRLSSTRRTTHASGHAVATVHQSSTYRESSIRLPSGSRR